MTGELVLVATPIGNLADLTFRALEMLKSADVVACEDTRHTRKLLNHYGIKPASVVAVHEHNEAASADRIVEQVRSGMTIALVTDAGTPGISDPGQRVVAAVAEAGLKVSTTPGAAAAISALVISGLPSNRFLFEGFLPRQAGERKRLLESLATEVRTLVFYEAPNRVAKTCIEMAAAFGASRKAALVRELTKIHEEVQRGSLEELAERLGDQTVKGECVIVVEGAPPLAAVGDDSIKEALSVELERGSSTKDAASTVAHKLHVSKKRTYKLALRVESKK